MAVYDDPVISTPAVKFTGSEDPDPITTVDVR
jgi:hypothetical protein